MRFLPKLDPYLVVPSLSISGLSIFILASTANNLFVSQIIFTVIGMILFFFFASIDYRIWNKFIYFFYFISIFLLSIIFLMPQVRGAHRWIDFGVFILQPSEILKPFIILLYASSLSRIKKMDAAIILWQILTFIPVLVLIFLQPDLGNTIVYLSFFIGLLIIGGVNLVYFFASLTGFIILLPGFWYFLRDYQKHRIYSFINPNLDPSGTGYNAIQSMIAIGSGGLFGLGLGRGTQSRLLFLPEYQTDFIFASLVESLGFIGGALLIVLYLFLLGRILIIALNSESIFGRIASIGIFCQIFCQVIINIGMNVGILPITGITLPLISYGGSSIISTYISLGIISAILKSVPKKLLVIR